MLSLFRRRKIYVPEFSPCTDLEILLNQYIRLRQMDTSMSLDRNGHTPEQIEYYNRERPVFFRKHGRELLDYLRPYEVVPKGAWLFPDEDRRWGARSDLLYESKKAESE